MDNGILIGVEEAVSMIEGGFKPMEEKAKEIRSAYSDAEVIEIAHALYRSQYYQVRAVGVFLFGYVACEDKQSRSFLKDTVSKDENWRI